MISDYFNFILRSLIHRKLRSWLTILGIVIGITAIVALIAVGQGLQTAVTEQFESLGSNKVFLMSSGPLGPFSPTTQPLTEKEHKIIEKTKGVENVVGFLSKSVLVEFNDIGVNTFVIGMPTTSEAIKTMIEMNADVEQGRNLKNKDKYKIIVGYRFAHREEAYNKKIKLGDKVKILDRDFEVVGIMQKIGNRQDDTQYYIPIDIAREIFNEPERFDFIVATTAEAVDPDKVAEDIKKKIRKERNLDPGDENFDVQSAAQTMETYGAILSIIQWVLIGIAFISLIVGGIGIMNTMYTSVLERKRHIGIMKAIGAKNSDILKIFVLESGFIGLVGGIAGVLIGITLAKLVEYYGINILGEDLLRAVFPPYLIISALAFSFVVGTISGLLPAIQASKLNPVDSLRK